MPIRWNPHHVKEALNRVEEALGQAKPFMQKAGEEARKGAQVANLPAYMVEPLGSLAGDIQQFFARCERHLRMTQERIPQAPVASTQRQSGPTLF